MVFQRFGQDKGGTNESTNALSWLFTRAVYMTRSEFPSVAVVSQLCCGHHRPIERASAGVTHRSQLQPPRVLRNIIQVIDAKGRCAGFLSPHKHTHTHTQRSCESRRGQKRQIKQRTSYRI